MHYESKLTIFGLIFSVVLLCLGLIIVNFALFVVGIIGLVGSISFLILDRFFFPINGDKKKDV